MKGPIGFELSEQAAKASDLAKELPSWCGCCGNPLQELLQIIECMDVEIASRGAAIQRMNEILGYDNRDGMHSTPTPEDLAKRAVEDAWKYRRLSDR